MLIIINTFHLKKNIAYEFISIITSLLNVFSVKHLISENVVENNTSNSQNMSSFYG
jgi:hypothetical protein